MSDENPVSETRPSGPQVGLENQINHRRSSEKMPDMDLDPVCQATVAVLATNSVE